MFFVLVMFLLLTQSQFIAEAHLQNTLIVNCLILYRYGEAGTHLDARGRVHLAETRGTWLRLEKFGRMTRPMTHLAETSENLAVAAKTTRI